MKSASPERACRDIERLLLDAAAGRPLSEADRARIAVHRADCPRCRAEAAAVSLLAQDDEGPADPLDEVNQRRLVNAVLAEAARPQAAPDLAPATRPRWRLAAAVAAGVLVAGTLATWWVLGRDAARHGSTTEAPRTAEVARFLLRVGEVDVDRPGAQGAPTGATSVTVGRGQAVLGLRDGSRVHLGPHTRIRVQRLDRSAVILRLERGTLLARVRPLPGWRPFRVVTPSATVQVTGTVFQVVVTPRATRVIVTRGHVRVQPPGRAPRSVRAGSTAQTRESSPMIVRPTLPEELQQVRAERQVLERLQPGSPVAHAPARPTAERAPPAMAPAPREAAPVPPRVAAPARPTAERVPPPTPRRSAHELLMDARQHRAARRWGPAVTAYRRLLSAHPRSAEARTSRVALGLILLQHRGDAAAALRLFKEYLARTRTGPLAQEAAYGRIHALQRLGRRTAERAACTGFLRRYPRALTAPLVRRRLEALKKDPNGSSPSTH